MFEAAVDGFGGVACGVGVVEVGQDVCGSAFECPAQRDELGEGGGNACGGEAHDLEGSGFFGPFVLRGLF